MKFFYSIKGCHSCDKREVCNLKNSRENLLEKPKTVGHINRSTFRIMSRERRLCNKKGEFIEGEDTTKPKPETLIRTSYCKDYNPEGT